MNSERVGEPVRVGRLVEQFLERSRQRGEAARAAAPEIAKAEAELRAKAAERREAGRIAHLRACGVEDDVLRVLEAGQPWDTPAVAGVRAWLLSPKPFCVLSGHVGAGKTVAASLSLLMATRTIRTMAHPLADEPVELQELDASRGLFTRASRLRFSDRYVEGRTLSLLDRAATVDWLVLDELRESDTKGAGLDRLEEVLGERYARNLRTCITTNLSQEEVTAAVGSKLASRFAEGAMVIDPGDDDLRRARGGA